MSDCNLGRIPGAAVLTGLLVLLGATSVGGGAQEPEFPEAPNQERSATETLFEQSDLGNVTQAARLQYHAGNRELQRAERLRRKQREVTDSRDKEKLEAKSLRAYEVAAEAFREALSYDPDLPEAYAGLGAACRGLGQNELALQVHVTALRKAPDDMENFRGWATSLLALNLLGNATRSYTDYARSDPARAEILMSEIKRWLADRQTDPGEVNPADVERLATWIAEQEEDSS